MISEIVLFDLPQGMSREEALAAMRRSLPRWLGEPDLIRKTLLYDPETGKMGGAYLWKNREAALRAHDAAWQAHIALQYGSPPVIRFFETPAVVENTLGAVIEDGRHPACCHQDHATGDIGTGVANTSSTI